MPYDVKDLRGAWTITSGGWIGGSWTYKLNVIFIIRNNALVDGIKGLKAYDSFKAVF